jgi:peptidoglycan/LPS O-acetylase OafA/YrhL
MGKIRLILALAVLASHGAAIWRFHFVGGQIAVQTFFIISGFYMSLILNEKYIGTNKSYKLFISNRFLRLFPIYWAVLIITLCFSLYVFLQPRGYNASTFYSYAQVKPSLLSMVCLVVTHLIIFGQDAIMYLGINPTNGNFFFTTDYLKIHPAAWEYLFIPQAWTLSLEMLFYLIAPFILRKGIKVVVAFIVLSFSIRLITYDYFNLRNDPWTYRFFPTELMFFLIGYLSYKIYLKIKNWTIPRNFGLAALFGTLSLIVVYNVLPSFSLYFLPFSFKEVFYFAYMTAAIPILFKFDKNNSIDTKIGELSYPVYIVHWTVITFCTGIPFLANAGWLQVLITLICAYLLNKLIALPIEKYRQLRIKRQ